MNKEKRNRYIASQRFAIHTLSGVFENEVNSKIKDEQDFGIKDLHTRNKKGKTETYLQLNPNKARGKELIYEFSEFCEAIENVMWNVLGKDPDCFKYNRCDFAFNSTNENDFKDFMKLNKLLICCLDVAYANDGRNSYRTNHLWHDKTLSIAIKKNNFEAENYDKAYQSNGKSHVANRLELRSKRINNNAFSFSQIISDEFLACWSIRLSKAITHFEEVQSRYNKCMIEDYLADGNDIYTNVNMFVRTHKDNFFTRKQLVEFYNALGCTNAEKKADNFKQRNKIEFFSMHDLEVVVNGLLDTAKEYFNR